MCVCVQVISWHDSKTGPVESWPSSKVRGSRVRGPFYYSQRHIGSLTPESSEGDGIYNSKSRNPWRYDTTLEAVRESNRQD